MGGQSGDEVLDLRTLDRVFGLAAVVLAAQQIVEHSGADDRQQQDVRPEERAQRRLRRSRQRGSRGCDHRCEYYKCSY